MIHLKPVSVSAKRAPVASAMRASSVEDATVVTSSARRGSAACSSRKSASSAPVSSPCRRRQDPSVAGDRDGEPVGVGIAGQDDVRVLALGRGDREVEHAGLLRVGPRRGREVGIGRGLLGDDRGRGEAGAVERLEGQRATDAVQRRVHDPQVARAATAGSSARIASR